MFEKLIRAVIEDYDNRHEILKLKELFEELSDREKDVLYYRFGKEMTLEETAKVYNVTRERIRQVEAKALRKLRCKKHLLVPTADRFSYELKQLKNHIESFIGECTVEPREPMTYEISIAECGFTLRTYNCLCRAQIYTVQDILKAIDNETLDKVKYLGRKSLVEILTYIKQKGFMTFDEMKGKIPYGNCMAEVLNA